jgi:predicted Rdx family selenoprotein
VVKVALKYCGTCNPQVNLRWLADKLALAAAGQGFELVPLSPASIDAVVILCGCPRACGNKDEVRGRARDCIVVAGESLDGRPVAEADLAAAAAERLLRLRDTFN